MFISRRGTKISGKKTKQKNNHPEIKKNQEFLQIFTAQIQALIYLWLEKSNIAGVERIRRATLSPSYCSMLTNRLAC